MDERGEGKEWEGRKTEGTPRVGSHLNVRNPENTLIAELIWLGTATQTFAAGGKHSRVATGLCLEIGIFWPNLLDFSNQLIYGQQKAILTKESRLVPNRYGFQLRNLIGEETTLTAVQLMNVHFCSTASGVDYSKDTIISTSTSRQLLKLFPGTQLSWSYMYVLGRLATRCDDIPYWVLKDCATCQPIVWGGVVATLINLSGNEICVPLVSTSGV